MSVIPLLYSTDSDLSHLINDVCLQFFTNETFHELFSFSFTSSSLSLNEKGSMSSCALIIAVLVHGSQFMLISGIQQTLYQ